MDNSLLLEYLINNMLAGLLSIKEPGKFISLGMKNTALSLNAKVNLLIDLGAVNRNDQGKFSHFMSIRNKFLHIREVTSFSLCLDSLGNDTVNFLNRNYPLTIIGSMERKYERQYDLLSAEVLDTAFLIYKKIEARDKEINKARKENLVSCPRNSLTKSLNLCED